MPLKKCRRLSGIPRIKGFKPLALPLDLENAVILELDEFEALKLMDYEGLIHEQAAKKMLVSRPTLSRIYENARKKIAKAFVEGKSILIQGGAVSSDQNSYRCSQCGQHFPLETDKDQASLHCPFCSSEEIVNIQQCFITGCGCCRKCLKE
jgi:uncharacterized protein